MTSPLSALATFRSARGILGELRERTELLRLDDLTQHPASAGFPDGHPPMRAFLGIPIRIREQVFGSLYVADDRAGHSFSESDEVTAQALASVAAVAIDNARLFEVTRIAALWTSASREITAAILSDGQHFRPLQLIAERVCELTEAEQAIVLFSRRCGSARRRGGHARGVCRGRTLRG